MRNVDRLVAARRHTRLRLHDLARMRISLKKVLPFIITPDHRPNARMLEADDLRSRFLPPPVQLELNWDSPPTTLADAIMSRSGEL